MQIVGSTLSDENAAAVDTNFTSEKSSSYFAELYRRDELLGGHVIALGPGNEEAAKSALGSYPGGLHYGGGVTVDNAVDFLDAGASHVIVTSFVFREGRVDEQRLAALVRKIGPERLVLDLSCRKKDGQYWVVTDRWQRFTDVAVNPETLEMLSCSCDEFLVHGVDVEGHMAGIEDELVSLLGTCSPLPVTYAGGARSLEDMDRVNELGSGRVDLTIGSALDIFGGSTPYRAVVEWRDGNRS